MSLQTTAPETRTNLCSYAKRILKIGSKLKKIELKSNSQLENDRPLLNFAYSRVLMIAGITNDFENLFELLMILKIKSKQSLINWMK